MPTGNKDLTVKITGKVELTEFQKLKKEFKDNQTALGELSIAGKQNSQVFQELTARQKALGTQIKEVTRETKGLQAQAKMSGMQLLELGENLVTVGAGFSLLGIGVVSFIKKAVESAADLEVFSKKFIELAGSEEEARIQLENLRVASAGNLNDIELVKYSNKMRLLGVSVEDTIQILDIVERKADEVGVSFSEGESALQSFIVSGRGRALKELGINLADVTRQMQIMTGYTIEQINKLEQDEIATIRLNAIKKLYGDTLENIGKKQKDSGDQIKSLTTAYENLSTGIGGVILPLFNELYNVYSKIDYVTKGLTGSTLSFGSALTEIVRYVYQMTNPIIALGVELSNLWDIWKRFTGGDTKVNTGATGDWGDPEAKKGTTSNTNEDISRRKAELQKLIDTSQKGSENFKYYTEQLKQFDGQVKKTGGTSRGFFKDDISEIKEIVQAVDEIELLKEQIFNKISRGGLSSTAIGNNGLPNAGLDINETRKLQEQFDVSILDAQLNKEKADPMAEWDKIKNVSSGVLSDIGNIMNVLNIGAETFAGQMLNTLNDIASGFNSVLNLINTFGGGGVGGIIGTVIGGIGSIFGLGRSSGSSGSSPDFSRFNGGRAGAGNNIHVSFGKIQFQLHGETINGSLQAYQTGQNERRYP